MLLILKFISCCWAYCLFLTTDLMSFSHFHVLMFMGFLQFLGCSSSLGRLCLTGGSAVPILCSAVVFCLSLMAALFCGFGFDLSCFDC